MTNRIADISLRQAAIIAGVGLLRHNSREHYGQ